MFCPRSFWTWNGKWRSTKNEQLGEGATLRVAPELADPVGLLEVGEHEDVEQLGAESRTEGVETLPESALELIGPHGRRLRRLTVGARLGHARLN